MPPSTPRTDLAGIWMTVGLSNVASENAERVGKTKRDPSIHVSRGTIPPR